MIDSRCKGKLMNFLRKFLFEQLNPFHSSILLSKSPKISWLEIYFAIRTKKIRIVLWKNCRVYPSIETPRTDASFNLHGYFRGTNPTFVNRGPDVMQMETNRASNIFSLGFCINESPRKYTLSNGYWFFCRYMTYPTYKFVHRLLALVPVEM